MFALLHNFLCEHQNNDEIFSEYKSDDMVTDENDEQSTRGNRVMCFIYFTMYGMKFVALTPNNHIDPMSWTLLSNCCNEDPTCYGSHASCYSYFLCNTNI